MAGANWVETAEQILRDEGGSVQAWKIQAPYDWDGTWTQPNDVELAWHIYLKGLDSGFNYYGGLGNDDEVKPGLATRRAIEKLQPWMTTARRDNDRTPPTVLKPQRFPYNPGGFTFGWFNQQPHIPNNAFLKRMNSDFYIWTHAYDLSGIPDNNVKLKIRIDNDGNNPLASNQNETFAGGSEVGTWVTLNMTKRVLPKTREALNAAAANPGEIDYFLPSNEQADYYFVKITDTNLPNFRNKLLDYYIEATDAKGNLHKSEIQHVWVDDFSGQTNGGGGGGNEPSSAVATSPNPPVAGQPVTITYNPTGRNLASATAVNIHHGFNTDITANWTPVPGVPMTKEGANWKFTYTVPANATIVRYVFNNGTGTWDNNGGGNWNINVSSQPQPTNPPPVPTGVQVTATTPYSVSLSWTASATATSYIVRRNGTEVGAPQDPNFVDTDLLPETAYTYTVRATNSAGSSADSVTVTATTLSAPPESNQIIVVDPKAATNVSLGSYLFRGRAGSALTNGLTWTNPLTGTSGAIAFSGGNTVNGWEWSTNIALGNGSNLVTFRGIYATSSNQTLTDIPANYSTWSNGATGGTGFGAWSLTTVTTNAGHFLANNPTNMNVGSSTGFGLWANNGGTSTATRNFNTPMAAGDSFALRFDNNWLVDGGETGFALADSNNNVKLRFYFVGGQNNYRITDATTARDSGLAYTNGGLNLTVTLTSSNSYTLSTGGTNITGTLAAAGGAISRLIVENRNAGPDTPYNLYIGALTHTRLLSDAGTASANAPAVTFGGVSGGFDGWRGDEPSSEEMLLKYAIGGAATPDDEAAVPQGSHDEVTGEFVLTVVVREDEALTVVGKTTGDLAVGQWTPVGVTAVEPPDLQSAAPTGCKIVQYRVSAQDGRRFLRLEVTHTP
jgi:hypothetical protein